MSIAEELTKLDAVRDALVVSVNSKGGELAEDATLWQVKAGIDNITISGGECDHPEANIGGLSVHANLDGTVEAFIHISEGLVTTSKTIRKTDSVPKVNAGKLMLSRLGNRVWANYNITDSGWIDKDTYNSSIMGEFYDIPDAEIVPPPAQYAISISKSPSASMAEIKATFECTSEGYVYSGKKFTDTVSIYVIEGGTYTPRAKDYSILPIPAGSDGDVYYILGDIRIKGDANLVPENIKEGISIFGVTGTNPNVSPSDDCIVYLGGNCTLYVKQGSGVIVGGLTKATSDRAGWDAYTGFTAGEIPGSVLSQDGVYLEWEGFDDLSRNWSIHSLMNSGYREEYVGWRIGWGFDRVDDQYGDWDSTLGYGTDISGFRCMAYAYKQLDPNGVSARWEFPDGSASSEVSPVHCVAYGLSHDNGHGLSSEAKLFFYGDHSRPGIGQGVKKLYEPPYYDEMMGGYMGNAYQYSLGNRLYLGKPEKCDIDDAQSGIMILNFALELASHGDGEYYSPFFTGAYKNL